VEILLGDEHEFGKRGAIENEWFTTVNSQLKSFEDIVIFIIF
jgi:hypothetical protein